MMRFGSSAAQVAPQPGSKRSSAGFSLVEVLVALLIMTMVSVIVATGVPSAINAYHWVVASSNAQAALATLTTVLRDELGSATSVTLSGVEVVCYKNSDSGGLSCQIEKGKENENEHGPVKVVTSEGRTWRWTLVPEAQLTASQGKGSLVASYGFLTYENHAFTVTNLVVKDADGNELATAGEKFIIRAPFCTVETS